MIEIGLILMQLIFLLLLTQFNVILYNTEISLIRLAVLFLNIYDSSLLLKNLITGLHT